MTRLIGSLAAVLLVLAACTSSTPSGGGGGAATPDPTIAFCAALDNYAGTLVKLDALPATASVDDYNAAVATAKAGLAAVVVVAGPFVGAQLNDAQTAQVNLEAAAAQLPPGATPAMAEIALTPLLETLIQEVASTRNAICNTRPTPSTAPAS
jgi:hypothetical protein